MVKSEYSLGKRRHFPESRNPPNSKRWFPNKVTVIVASNLFLRYDVERLRSICQQQKVGKLKNSILSYTRLSRARTLPSLLCCWVWGTTIMISKPTVWFFLDHWSLRKCDFLYNSIFHIPYILICHCVMHDAHLIYWRNCFFLLPGSPYMVITLQAICFPDLKMKLYLNLKYSPRIPMDV